MPTPPSRTTAADILPLIGGPGNVRASTHCATRLRLTLVDPERADTAAVEALPEVLAVVQAAGQYQIVVGNDVPSVHRAFQDELGEAGWGGSVARSGSWQEQSGEGRRTGRATDEGAADAPPSRGSLLNQFIELISSIFQPIVWALAATGLLKAFLSLGVQLTWLDEASSTYTILSAAADGVFLFLPVFLAVTAARRFGAHQFTAMAIAAALVHPTISTLAESGDPVRFVGIPVAMMTYTYSIIPIVVAVWIQSHLERALDNLLPAVIRSFATPLVTVLVMVPGILITVGPLTISTSELLSQGINSLFDVAPWLAGAVVGGSYQILVIFGLHWGLDPISLSELSGQGYTLLMGPMVAPVFAQAAAALAVLVRTRNSARRKVAGPAVFSGFLAGVTEPAIYGVNLPLKRPFWFGIIGGIIGGAFAGAGGVASTAYVFYSVLSLPAFSTIGSFSMMLIGLALAVSVAFTLTFVFFPREALVVTPEEEVDREPKSVPVERSGIVVTDEKPEHMTGSITTPEASADREADDGTASEAGRVPEDGILVPVNGQLISLGSVDDKVFASGALGQGFGVVPEDGYVHAPASGTLLTVQSSGHAYGIATDDGHEVLVHIGIDTVQLDGHGFRAAVRRGDRVEAGDLLADVDLRIIADAGYDPTVLVVLLDSAGADELEIREPGAVRRGHRGMRLRR